MALGRRAASIIGVPTVMVAAPWRRPNAAAMDTRAAQVEPGARIRDLGGAWSQLAPTLQENVMEVIVRNSPTAVQQGLQVCKPGPSEPLSKTTKNCLVIGDSVSIGYTPFLANALGNDCFVQHRFEEMLTF